MTPRFANSTAWQQAQLLMQPSFIRVIDNIRKHLDTSSWKGTYHDVHRWPDGATQDQQQQVIQLQKALETATPEQADDIHQTLDRLPHPYPGYELHLTQGDRTVDVDLWQLCYHVCFREFTAPHAAGQIPVEVDTLLIDETGDVDWQHLDDKARHLIEQIFENLSA
jgi:hypothetical protein